MIEGLKISNFQSHRDSSLEFSPGVNALVGDSDCGKSAVMRALLWVITNQPQGDAHVSNWLKDKKGKVKGICQVSVLLDTGTVTRSRGKDENSYEYRPDDDGSPVEAPSVRYPMSREIARMARTVGPPLISRRMVTSMDAGVDTLKGRLPVTRMGDTFTPSTIHLERLIVPTPSPWTVSGFWKSQTRYFATPL